MLLKIIGRLLLFFVTLRYRISIRGLDKISKIEGRGILFLPNHPAYIDPFILYALLLSKEGESFGPRVLIDEKQANRPGLGFLLKQINGLKIPHITKRNSQKKEGGDSHHLRDKIDHSINSLIASLAEGEDVLLYPGGRVYRSFKEEVSGGSAVHRIVTALPTTSIVLIRTDGLWGSTFSYAPTNRAPDLSKLLLFYLKIIFFNFLFFVPKREVVVEFLQDYNFPINGTRSEINKYLSNYYNEIAREPIFVPYYFFLKNSEKARYGSI